jgi:hypothetical protein
MVNLIRRMMMALTFTAEDQATLKELLAGGGKSAAAVKALQVTGCKFSGVHTLPTLAVGEVQSGGGVWGRQKSTRHAEAACGMKGA